MYLWMITGKLSSSHAITDATSSPRRSMSMPSPMPRSTLGRSGTTASRPASPTPMTFGDEKTPPLLYQLTFTEGTEPVWASKLPLIEKCGRAPTEMRGRVSLSDPTSADIWRQAPMMALEAVEAALFAELAKSRKEALAAVAMDWLGT